MPQRVGGRRRNYSGSDQSLVRMLLGQLGIGPELIKAGYGQQLALVLPGQVDRGEASSLCVILIPIIAGRVLRATRARCAGSAPNFRSALLRRLSPPESSDFSRSPKLHSGPSCPAVIPVSERHQEENLFGRSFTKVMYLPRHCAMK